MTYFGARYMDETTGRFISPDPVRPVDAFTSKTNAQLLTDPQRLNRYAYGLNNPYRYVDPDGEWALPLVAVAAVALLTDDNHANAPESPGAPTSASASAGEFAGAVALEAGGLKGGGKLFGRLANVSEEAAFTSKIADKWSRTPRSIQDQMTLDAAKMGKGERIMKNLIDSRFKGMEKWEYKVKSTNGKDSVVHYV